MGGGYVLPAQHRIRWGWVFPRKEEVAWLDSCNHGLDGEMHEVIRSALFSSHKEDLWMDPREKENGIKES